MKKSPFELLREAIESERFDNSLRMQDLLARGVDFNPDYFLAVSTVLDLLLARANYIYKHHRQPPF